MHLPLLVSVTHLRRKTTDVLRQVAETRQPDFVTQYRSVELVLLTCRTYERLLRAAEREAESGAGPASASGAGPAPAAAACPGREPDHAGETERAPAETRADVVADPLAVFGRLPRGTLFGARWGLVDATMAAFFMEEGFEVKPHLSPERLRAALEGAG